MTSTEAFVYVCVYIHRYIDVEEEGAAAVGLPLTDAAGGWRTEPNVGFILNASITSEGREGQRKDGGFHSFYQRC